LYHKINEAISTLKLEVRGMFGNRLVIKDKGNVLKGILVILPALIIYTMIVYYPLVRSFAYSVTNFDGGIKAAKFIGLSNFKDMFKDDLVISGILNTFKFTIFTTIFANFIALLLALILDSNIKSKHYLRAVFFIPCLINYVVISAVFSNILQYNGLLNSFFDIIGLSDMKIDWFGSTGLALPMLMSLNVWQWAGYGAIIYLAGLQSIPREYYEAAEVDGSGKFNTFTKITFPLLAPSFTIMTFMSLTGGLKLFELPYVLTKGGPGNATQTIGTAIYTLAFGYSKMGYATAVSIVFFVIIAILSVIQVYFMRRNEVQL
jgi:raffinose/stachyose/melibiose transport system permease protein